MALRQGLTLFRIIYGTIGELIHFTGKKNYFKTHRRDHSSTGRMYARKVHVIQQLTALYICDRIRRTMLCNLLIEQGCQVNVKKTRRCAFLKVIYRHKLKFWRYVRFFLL